MQQLKEQFEGYKVTNYPISVTLIFFNPDNRRHDLDNQSSSVLDTLVKAGVIEDDNQTKIDSLQLHYGGIDKENPRCEIFLDD